MTPKYKKRSGYTGAELTCEQRRHLLRGVTFFGAGFTHEDDFREAWEQHRDELLEEFVRKHPGRRPFGWWLCDHGKERPIVSEWATPELVRKLRCDPEHFGYLHTSAFGGVDMLPLQQIESSYLEDAGLLTDVEIRILAAERGDDE